MISRITLATTTLLLSISMRTNALVPAGNNASVDRRQMFGIVGSVFAGAAAIVSTPEQAQAAAIRTGASNPLTGEYDDPNHPNCLRSVKVVGAPLRADGTRPVNPIIEVVGYDGNGSEKFCSAGDRPTRSDLWKIEGKMKSNTVASLDFSSKGGPAGVTGTWDGTGIVFPDGNKWTKVTYGTNTKNRFPEDMSTLKSEN